MRGVFERVLAVFLISIGAAACQSPTAAVGALQGFPFSPSATAPFAAAIQPASAMPTGPVAATPVGFVSFCARFRDQCAAPSGSPAEASVTPRFWETLNQVNAAVNANIWPEDDLKHYGRSEYWTIPTDGYGDCDDYALTKRKDLIAAGLPELALRVAVVVTQDGSRHAVLTVTTDKGDYVLDNMRAEILPWSETGYTWIERQGPTNPLQWVRLQNGDSSLQIASVDSPTADSDGRAAE
jgi:predicted transglutaminase-like cysteine proteinase